MIRGTHVNKATGPSRVLWNHISTHARPLQAHSPPSSCPETFVSHPHTSHLLEKVSNAQEKALFFFHLFLNFLHYSELSLCFLLSFLSMLGLCYGTQASFAAEHGLSSRGSVLVAHRLRCPHGMWDLPGPEIEPLSPALENRSSTTGPPGKSLRTLLIQAKEPNLTNSKKHSNNVFLFLFLF